MRKVKKTLGITVVFLLVIAAVNLTALADAVTVPAAPTSSAVFVNGSTVSFQAYTIDGHNYFKLRDLGKALSGTEKQFEIGYDETSKTIVITTGKAYTPIGGELTTTGDTANQQATVSQNPVYLDGEKAALSAYTIGGYNYLKLRDVGAAIDFGVTYDDETKNIGIDTSRGYTSDTETPAKTSNPLIGAWHFDAKSGGETYTSYLIFSEDGNLTQFIGSKTASYNADANSIYVTAIDSKTTSICDYTISTADGQTSLSITYKPLGLMVRDGVTEKTGADVIPGLWMSKNTSVYGTNTPYFYFTKDGGILLGVIHAGSYSVSASGSSWADTVTDDGSYQATDFEISVVGGVTQLTATDSGGHVTVMFKE